MLYWLFASSNVVFFCCAGSWIVSSKVWENIVCAWDQNCLLLESWYCADMICGRAKNVLMYTVPHWFGPVMWGGGLEVFSIKRSMVVGYGCLEVWRVFSTFSSEIWFHTYIGTDSRDLANGYPLCTYIYLLWYTRCHLLAYTYIHWHCTKLAHNL